MENRRRRKGHTTERSSQGTEGIDQVPENRRDTKKPTGELRTSGVSASLRRYRESNPLPESRLSNGLLREGVRREVTTDDMEYPVTVETFTVAEASEALGKSDLTIRRWIAEEWLPPPVLRDTSRGYRHYSVGELRVIATVLRAHEREYVYYGAQHAQTRIRLEQAVHAYRARFV